MSYKLITSWNKNGDTSLISLDVYNKKSIDKSNISLNDFNVSKNTKRIKNTPQLSTSSNNSGNNDNSIIAVNQKQNSIYFKPSIKSSLIIVLSLSLISLVTIFILPSILNYSSENNSSPNLEEPLPYKNNILDTRYSIDEYKKSLKSLEDLK